MVSASVISRRVANFRRKYAPGSACLTATTSGTQRRPVALVDPLELLNLFRSAQGNAEYACGVLASEHASLSNSLSYSNLSYSSGVARQSWVLDNAELHTLLRTTQKEF